MYVEALNNPSAIQTLRISGPLTIIVWARWRAGCDADSVAYRFDNCVDFARLQSRTRSRPDLTLIDRSVQRGRRVHLAAALSRLRWSSW